MIRKGIVLVLCLAVGTAFFPETAGAVSVPRITVDRESYSFDDPEKAYVSGDVYPASGQTVSMYAWDRRSLIGTAKMAHDGGKGSFSIKVSANLIKDKPDVTVYLRTNAVKGVAASKYIAVKIENRKLKNAATTKPAVKKQPAKKTAPKKTASGKKSKKKKKSKSPPAAVTAVTKKLKSGKKPSAAEGRAAAAAWARWIAADNRFTYGPPPYSKHNGCYFCGTNGRKKREAKNSRWANGYKGKKWNRTYCCNTFVHACYAHGAQHPRVLKYCRKKQAVDMTRASYRKMKCFKYMGKPAFSKLKAGDIFVNSYHLWIYVGKGQLAEATTVGSGRVNWGANTIRIRNNAKKRYRGCSYVMRFTGY